MIKPMFKLMATILIGIILGSSLIITYDIINQQTIFNFKGDLFFIMYICIFGLIFLGIIFILWAREINIYYNKRKSVKK